VISGTADEPSAVEGAEQRLAVDAVPDAGGPGRPACVADRPERPAAQIQFRLEVVTGVQRAKLDVAQELTRAFP
jgi:hypothetical protein